MRPKQPSTAAASSCAATGARRLEAFRAHEDTRRKRLPTVRAGVRRSSRATAGRAPGRLIEEEPPDDDATARPQIPAESPAARLRRMVYEVYLRHGEVVLSGVVRASPGCRRLIGQPCCHGCDQRWRGLCGVIPSELRGWVETRAATERSAARRRVAAPRPASHANACALPGPRHSFARDGEDTSHSGSVLQSLLCT